MSRRWLSVDKIAAHLGVDLDRICKRITRRNVPARKLGRLLKFPAREMETLEHRRELTATTIQTLFMTC